MRISNTYILVTSNLGEITILQSLSICHILRAHGTERHFILVFFSFFQDSKRSSDYFQSRTDGNVITIFKKEDFLKPGDYAIVKVKESNSLTLKADLISKSSILEFSNFTPNNNIIEIDQKCQNSMQ